MNTDQYTNAFVKGILHGFAQAWPVAIPIALLATGYLALGIYRRIRIARSGISEIDQMSGLEFEQYLEWLFRKLGYNVERTKYQSDYGADLVVSRGGMKTAIQAKRSKRKVGNKAVQEAVASAGHYRCQQSMVVTNSFFTRPAIELARDNKVELWDRNRLVSELLKVRTKAEAEVEPSGADQPEPAPRYGETTVCATCGSPVPERVRDYCLDHQKRFAGKVYCYQCQRRPRRVEE